MATSDQEKWVTEKNAPGACLTDRERARLKAQQMVDAFVRDKARVKVLEAGCGSESHVDVGNQAYIVGIDTSEDQLVRNNRLSEKIHGDIQTYPLPPAEFDIVVCWNVLEHVSRPQSALRNFMAAIRPGGMIVLAMPNSLSSIGIITKLTPHWLHLWGYQHFWGRKLTDGEHRLPFRTFMRLSMSPWAIRRFAHKDGLIVDYMATYDPGLCASLRKRSPIAGAFLRLCCTLLATCSFGVLDGTRAACVVILRKP